ncbi:MAG TPA: condensation domain-containing protein, partial [Pyrinomonadaceae bacterium]
MPRAGNLPLSFAQERLWFLDQLDPGSPSYLVVAAVRLSGALNRPAFERALNELVRRHEVLRTCFGLREGRPVQLITPSLPIPLLLVDLTHLPEAGREEEARRLAAEEARRPFDLSRLPLLRATLLRLSDSEHLALLTLHHIVTDGWSMAVLVREVAALYEAFTKGEGSPLPELPIQYADYAAWQKEFLQGEVLDGQLSYWREALEGAPRLELPTDRPRPAAQSYRGAHHQFAIDAEAWRGVRELARAEGATPFMVLLTAFYVLLGRYAGQRDVSVGTPVAGRTRTEAEGLIGLFVNTLVLRARWEEGEGFRGLLRGVRERVLEAQAHQELPFERLVEELQPERSLSRTPLFQVMFVMQNSLLPALKLAGVEMSVVG